MKIKKYILTDESKIIDGRKVYRIKYLIDIPKAEVKAGDLGGWIEREANLSQTGDCVVLDNAVVLRSGAVFDNAKVNGDAIIDDCAWITKNAFIYGNAIICDNAYIEGRANIGSNVIIKDSVHIKGYTFIVEALLSGQFKFGSNNESWISDGVRITGQKGGLLIRQIDDSDKEMFKHYYNKYNN